MPITSISRGLGMPTGVGNRDGGLRNSSAQITQALERVPDLTGKLIKLLIVETTAYQPGFDHSLLPVVLEWSAW